VNGTYFEELRELITAGRRFSPGEIALLKASSQYKNCSFTERAFIDVLLGEYTGSTPTAGEHTPIV
jgi:hypothetical protein